MQKFETKNCKMVLKLKTTFCKNEMYYVHRLEDSILSRE